MGETSSATFRVLFSAAVARLFGIISLALAYLVPKRLKDAPWGARIGRFPASRFFVCGGLDVNVCPRWTEQAT